ncbi:MAG: toxin-antitoxin system HicB family antitoxin [Gemmatimonadota bacterium]|nr:toxin-antitoxin system HicB family antitoxin [Gemmatimonadota bacterium]
MTKRRKQTSVYPLRLPASLKTAVREVSQRDGTSINQFVATAVAEKLAADFFAEHRAQADIEEARRILRRPGGQPPGPADKPTDHGSRPPDPEDRRSR